MPLTQQTLDDARKDISSTLGAALYKDKDAFATAYTTLQDKYSADGYFDRVMFGKPEAKQEFAGANTWETERRASSEACEPVLRKLLKNLFAQCKKSDADQRGKMPEDQLKLGLANAQTLLAMDSKKATQSLSLFDDENAGGQTNFLGHCVLSFIYDRNDKVSGVFTFRKEFILLVLGLGFNLAQIPVRRDGTHGLVEEFKNFSPQEMLADDFQLNDSEPNATTLFTLLISEAPLAVLHMQTVIRVVEVRNPDANDASAAGTQALEAEVKALREENAALNAAMETVLARLDALEAKPTPAPQKAPPGGLRVMIPGSTPAAHGDGSFAGMPDGSAATAGTTLSTALNPAANAALPPPPANDDGAANLPSPIA